MNSLAPAAATVLACTGMLCSLAAVVPARAALGQPATSVAADQLRMKGQIRHATGTGYRVDQITAPGGTLVKEFISPAGIVFAVSWRGPTLPNLAQTLGSTYFGMLKTAERTERAGLGHNHVQLRTPQLVVHAGGHMRYFFGMAYVPSLLPPNVSVADLH